MKRLHLEFATHEARILLRRSPDKEREQGPHPHLSDYSVEGGAVTLFCSVNDADAFEQETRVMLTSDELSPADFAQLLGWMEHKAAARLLGASTEDAPDLLAVLRIVDANAAESPEWIRRHTGPAIAQAEGRT